VVVIEALSRKNPYGPKSFEVLPARAIAVIRPGETDDRDRFEEIEASLTRKLIVPEPPSISPSKLSP
jgi:hypothetical protein